MKPRKKWKVYFKGNFWGGPEGACPGEELRLNRQFTWNGWAWLIPAIYRCGQGIVVDFAANVPETALRSFMEKWGIDESGECSHTPTKAEERRMEQENPLEFDFYKELELNGTILHSAYGCGVSYLPFGGDPDRISRKLVRHYGLDETKIWRFWRASFSWAIESRKNRVKRFRKLEMRLEAANAERSIATFRTPAVGASIQLKMPDQAEEYRLTVMDTTVEKLELPSRDGWELPNRFRQMIYTVKPDLSETVLRLYDCAEGDRPRRTPRTQRPRQTALAEKYGLEPPLDHSSAIAVIGGCDGPTVVFAAPGEQNGEGPLHAVCSATHFDPAALDEVVWEAVYYEKPCGDAVVLLI